jgi:hypothetical protein
MYDDEARENQQAAEGVVGSIKSFMGERCCVFMDAETYDDTCHGKLLALVKEWPALVVRDLSPGGERLQRKRIIPLDAIRDVCLSPGLEKCRACETMKEMLKESEKESDGGSADA